MLLLLQQQATRVPPRGWYPRWPPELLVGEQSWSCEASFLARHPERSSPKRRQQRQERPSPPRTCFIMAAPSKKRKGGGASSTGQPSPAAEDMKLGDFCTKFRGRGSTSGTGSASKKRQRSGSNRSSNATKRKKPVGADRPGVEIVNGEMVIRPLEIGGCQSDQEDDREEVDEESGMTSTYSSFTNRTRTERWGIEETRRFYKCLQQCGTDFTMMMTLFPGRTQKQLKNKFRKESRAQPDLVNKALNPKIAKPLDVDPFQSSLGVGIHADTPHSTEPPATSTTDAASADTAGPPEIPPIPRATSLAAVVPEAFDSSRDDQLDLVDV